MVLIYEHLFTERKRCFCEVNIFLHKSGLQLNPKLLYFTC